MAKAKAKTITAFCPACSTRIRFAERPKVYDIVVCPECEESFEVSGLTPLRLEWVADYASENEWLDGDDWLDVDQDFDDSDEDDYEYDDDEDAPAADK